MILQGPHQLELPIAMLDGKLLTLDVIERRPVPLVAVIPADEVTRNPAGVIGGGLSIGNEDRLKKLPFLTNLDRAKKNFVASGGVVFRF